MIKKIIQQTLIIAFAVFFTACSHQETASSTSHSHPHHIEHSNNPFTHLSKQPYADAGKSCTDNKQCESRACQVNDNEAFIISHENPHLTFKGQCAVSEFQKEVSCLNRLVKGNVLIQGCD